MDEPGLYVGPRELRLYPNGPVAAHVLGGAHFGLESVDSAEIVGTAGVEKFFDLELRDTTRVDEPLVLSIDLSVQYQLEEVLSGGMRLMNAKGAAAVVMDIHSGEVIALASLPDFDPNNRPRFQPEENAADSPLFNRAVQGVYELGSSFKIFPIAQAMELELITPETSVDVRGPLEWGRYRIRDFRNYGDYLTATEVVVKSSNIRTSGIAQTIGTRRQRQFLASFGHLDATSLEVAEAAGAISLTPSIWSEISSMTIEYGHGVATSPLHLATAYSKLANGGHTVNATLVKGYGQHNGPSVISRRVSEESVEILRQVVTHGAAAFADVPGYSVGGKTGTADKPRPTGGYFDDKVIATFAAVFPSFDPRYVLVVTLDEPEETSGPTVRRTAGWTAVPVAAEIIRRIGPELDMSPRLTPDFSITDVAD